MMFSNPPTTSPASSNSRSTSNDSLTSSISTITVVDSHSSSTFAVTPIGIEAILYCEYSSIISSTTSSSLLHKSKSFSNIGKYSSANSSRNGPSSPSFTCTNATKNR
uniref:(northern house mosquito) hypothetical protein n=1 Tax=Culex pipiens TaxID=7175 RepID=A0A8D8PI18_CULPI